MRVNIELKNGIPSDIKNYIEKTSGKLRKFIKNDSVLHIVVSLQKGRFQTEYTLEGEGPIFHSSFSSSNIKLSINTAQEKLEHQLKKFKEKISNHRKKEHLSNTSEEVSSQIIETKRIILDVLSIDEAIKKFSSSSFPFFVFINKETNKQNIISKSKDNTYLLLEIEKD